MPPKQIADLDQKWGTYHVIVDTSTPCTICKKTIPAGTAAKYDTGIGFHPSTIVTRQGYRHKKCCHPPARKP